MHFHRLGPLLSMMSLLGCGSSGAGAAGVAEVFTVTTNDDVMGSLLGLCFEAEDAAGTVVFQLDSGGAGAPPGGYDRAVVVTHNISDAAADIAAAIVTALSGDSGFSASAVGNVATITCLVAGARADAADISTGFGITTTQQGSP